VHIVPILSLQLFFYNFIPNCHPIVFVKVSSRASIPGLLSIFSNSIFRLLYVWFVTLFLSVLYRYFACHRIRIILFQIWPAVFYKSFCLRIVSHLIINSAFRLQFLLCPDIIVVLFQLISSLLSFPLFLCWVLNLNAAHTNFHTFWSTLLVHLHPSSLLFRAFNTKRMAAQLSQLWVLFMVSLIQNIWQRAMHEKYSKPTYNEVLDLFPSFCEVPKLLALLLYFSSWWKSSYRRLIWNKNTTLCT
jgi:hypothetical protein